MTAEANWVVEAWVDELKVVLQFLTAEEWSATISAPTSGSSPVGYLWWAQKYNIAPEAQLAVGAPALAWSELGARVLQAAGVDLIEQASAKSTYLEALQQSMSGLSRAFSERAGSVVDAIAGRDEAPSRSGEILTVVLSTGGFDLPALRIDVSSELAAAFQDPSQPAQKTIETVALATTVGPTALTKSVPTPAPASPAVSVLLDVQMPVSICFGRASLPLREVLKLTTGSAVELDRRPDDEVDIIVNNCVIARGEVVVIDGNYGVRVTGIISREQRMALRAGVR